VEHESSGRAGQSRRDDDELGPDGAGGGAGVQRSGERAGSAGEFEGDRGEHEPGAVGGELAAAYLEPPR